MPEVVALAQPDAVPPPGMVCWALLPLAAWVGPPLRDPAALADRVIALGRAHVNAPVLPFRAGLHMPDPQALSDVLGPREPWRARLEALADWWEFGVHWPRPTLKTRTPPAGPGARWLAHLRTVHAADLARDAAVEELRDALAPLDCQARAIGADAAVVRIALLVRAGQHGTVKRAVEERGLTLTGPWAPASFSAAPTAGLY